MIILFQEKNLILITLKFNYFKTAPIVNKSINKLMFSILGLKWTSYILTNNLKMLKYINKKDLFLTDTSRLLANVDFLNFKATIFHSITYKKHFLHSHNLKYKYIFLPGRYHKKRFEKKFKNLNIPTIKIVGNLKKENLILENTSQIDYLNKKLNLIVGRKNIIFGPTFTLLVLVAFCQAVLKIKVNLSKI